MPLWLEFRETLRQPEYVHVLLNPLPVYGLALGLLASVFAWAARSRPAQGLALALICVAGLSAWPAAHFGEAGYDRVYSMSGPEAQKWLNWHQHLAERAAWACYAAALLAIVSLSALRRGWRSYRAAALLTVGCAILGLALGGFAGYAGGRIRHSEFRRGAPPAWADTSADSG